MKFNYKARTKEGESEKGVIEASSKEAAVLLLQKYDVFVTSLEEQKIKGPLLRAIRFEKKISKKDLAIFFRQLSVMLESRVPVVQSLNSLAVQVKKNNFKKVLTEVSKLVEEGTTLSDALDSYPKFFDTFYVSLVRAGETSGNISEALAHISENLERESDIIAQLRQAAIYPILVFSAICLVVAVVISQVVPKIKELIEEIGKEPPLFTVMMLNFYGFLQNYWWLVLSILFFLSISAVLYFKTKEGRMTFNKISLKIPILRTLLKKVFVARFCSNLTTLLSAGIPINRTLSISQDTVNNYVYKKIIARMEKEVSEGEKISSVMLRFPDYFPGFVVQMIRVGEETGKLDQTLKEVVNFYQKDVKRSLDLFSSLLEPVMIIFMGIIVALLAISVLSPLYEALGTI